MNMFDEMSFLEQTEAAIEHKGRMHFELNKETNDDIKLMMYHFRIHPFISFFPIALKNKKYVVFKFAHYVPVMTDNLIVYDFKNKKRLAV